MSKWSKFYSSRIMNNEYLNYFENKYQLFIELVENNIKERKSMPKVMELGCGTGLVTKILIERNCKAEFTIVDNDKDILRLATINLQGLKYIKRNEDIRALRTPADIVISHGVLEHFTDADVSKVLKTTARAVNFHYVPLAKYKKPSFGDERLITEEEWGKNTGLQTVSFNNKFDCVLTKGGKGEWIKRR